MYSRSALAQYSRAVLLFLHRWEFKALSELGVSAWLILGSYNALPSVCFT